MSKYLSKSKYLAGLECPRKLWLLLWRPELQSQPQGMDKLIMEQGSLFGQLAHKLYPEGILLDIDIRDLLRAEDDTRAAIEEGATVLMEATFRHGQCRILSDIVEQLDDGSWHLVEVKSSTSVKEVHIPDLAYQRYVMEACGYSVSRCSVMYANRNGKLPFIESLFTLQDVTERVAAHLSQIEASLRPLVPLLEDSAACPAVVYQKGCVGCDFQSHCWQGIERATIYEVIDIRKIEQMEALGIFYVDDIPAGFPLSGTVRNTVERMQAQRVDVDKAAVKHWLDKLEYPLYYLDFESAATAVPLFDDASPWQKYAFQYSLHIEQADGHIDHIEFLHQCNSDPSEALALSLVTHVGDSGSLIVYHRSMESGVLMDLARQFPALAGQLKDMSGRICDLELVFKKHYRHWQWGTKSSIKKVLPTLVPALSYKDLEIQEGGSATAEWIAMIRSGDTLAKARIGAALRRYCELDTLAMLKLVQVLRQEIA